MVDMLNLLQLPVTRRGRFMQDDFFKDFQNDFGSAVEDVVDRHTGRSLLADHFTNYRKLREKTPETGPAASISDTSDSYVIVLDMNEFLSGSISVRTRGLNAIVDASNDSKTFNRKFPLPANTNIDGVTTAMSNEGILTISAPKKNTEKEPCSNAETTNELEESLSSLKIDCGEPERAESKPESAAELTELRTDCSGRTELEGSATASSLEDRILSISRKGKFFEDSYFENVWRDFDRAMDDMIGREELRRSAAREQRRTQRKELIDKLKSDMLLDAELKEFDFFDHKPRRSTRITTHEIPSYGRMNSYENLRSWAPSNENQAFTITKDEHGYKIVLDVKGWSNNQDDFSVKASEGLLTVCGRKGSLKVEKEFTLKNLKNPDNVHASLSEDGILTITVAV